MELYKTTIPKLDDLLNGGIMPSSITIFWAVPGVENSPFAYQIMAGWLREGGSCIYITQTKNSIILQKEIEHYGWDISNYRKEGKLIFIDAYSDLINAKSPDKFFVEGVRNPNAITSKLKGVLDSLDGTRNLVILDSISTMIDHCGENSLDEIAKWKEMFKEKNVTGIFLFIEWPYEDRILNKLKLISDAIVRLKAVEQRVILREYFTVMKASWDGNVRGGVGVPFKICAPGGVKIYIPKILVTGPYNAGKSSFVHSASTTAVSVERLGTTIALDHGHVEYAGFSVDLFGSPGQERFDPILGLLGEEALGVVVVVDATDPDGFPRAKEMMQKSMSVGLPYVVVANKSNLDGALTPDEVRDRMNLAAEVPVIPTRAEKIPPKEMGKSPARLNNDDVHKVLKSLFDNILK